MNDCTFWFYIRTFLSLTLSCLFFASALSFLFIFSYFSVHGFDFRGLSENLAFHEVIKRPSCFPFRGLSGHLGIVSVINPRTEWMFNCTFFLAPFCFFYFRSFPFYYTTVNMYIYIFFSCCFRTFSRFPQQHLFSCCLPFSQVNNFSLLFYRKTLFIPS